MLEAPTDPRKLFIVLMMFTLSLDEIPLFLLSPSSLFGVVCSSWVVGCTTIELTTPKPIKSLAEDTETKTLTKASVHKHACIFDR